jgi:hypothetical protein
MKSNQIISLIFNPFTRIAGWEALALGLFFASVSALLGTYSRVVTDGVMDIHLVNSLELSRSFFITSISLLSLIVCMILVAYVISGNFRIIDIAGTLTLSKAPVLIAVIAGFFTHVPNQKTVINNPTVVFHSTSFIVVSLIIIPIAIWMIALSFNALKISTGAKGNKLIISFIIGLVLAEIISKVCINLI